jgi:hypothetical protein
MRPAPAPPPPSSAPRSVKPGAYTGVRDRAQLFSTPTGPARDDKSTFTPGAEGAGPKPTISVQPEPHAPPPPLPPPHHQQQQLDEPLPAPSRPKSPAYLQGKNPYGRFLDKVEHPYREPKPEANGLPSQLGSSAAARPRTFGSLELTYRSPLPPVPKPEAAPISAPEPPQVVQRPLPKAVSVQAAKSFFESKASEARKAPPFPPSTSALIAKRVRTSSRIKPRSALVAPGHDTTDDEVRLARVPSPAKEPLATWDYAEPSLSVSEPPPEAAKQTGAAKRTDPFAQPKPVTVVPKVLVNWASATEHRGGDADSREPQTAHSVEFGEDTGLEARSDEESRASRRKSTNVFTEPRRPVQHLGDVQQSVKQQNKLNDRSDVGCSVVEPPHIDGPSSLIDNSVRRPPIRNASTAETESNVASSTSQRVRTTQRSPPSHRVRGIAPSRDDRQASSGNEARRRTNPNSKQTNIVERHATNTDVTTKPAKRQLYRGAPYDQKGYANWA